MAEREFKGGDQAKCLPETTSKVQR